MKRRKTSGFAKLLELNRVPVTPVKSFDRETLTQYNDRMRREAEAAANAPILALIEQQSAAVRQTQKVVAAYWSQPLADIQKDCEKNAAAVDDLFQVPALRDSFTVEDMQSAFQTWYEQEMPKGAYTLTQNGQSGPILFLFGLVAARRNSVDMSNAAAWQAAFDRLRELGVFQTGREVAFDSSKVAVEPEPVAAPVLSEEARLDQEFFNEAGVLFKEWVAFMQRKHDYSVSVEDQKYIANVLIPRNNWSYHQHTTYDKVRRAMIRLGRFPETLYTKDELMSRAIENTNLGTLTYEDRMRIASDLQQLTERQS